MSTVVYWFARDRRRSTLLWTLGMVATVSLVAAFWPTVEGTTAFDDAIADLPASLRELFGVEEGVPMSSPQGYLGARLFSMTLPLLLVVFGIGLGAAAVAGSEEAGTLELLLAHPVSRRQVLWGRAAVVTGSVVGLTLVAAVATVVVGTPIGMLDGVDRSNLALAFVALGCLALLHTVVALVVGAVTGRHGMAVAVAAVLAVGGSVVEGLLAAAGWSGPLVWLSPWHWYLDRNLLVEGAPLVALVAPLVLSAVLLAVADRGFDRRDLR